MTGERIRVHRAVVMRVLMASAVAMLVAVLVGQPATAQAAPDVAFVVEVSPVTTDFSVQSLSASVTVPTTAIPLGGTMFLYAGSYSTGGMYIQYSHFVDTDPVVTNNIVITNLTGTTQVFNGVLYLSTLAVNLDQATVVGGSVDVDVRSNKSYGATLSAVGSTPIYTALYEQNSIWQTWTTMVQSPAVPLITTGYNHANTSDVFGDLPVIPSQVGPVGSLASPITGIAIQLSFTLSAYATATISSDFVMEPIPEPASLALLGAGVLLMVRRSGRRA